MSDRRETTTPSLYRQVMGPSFETLAPELRALHTPIGTRIFNGHCEIEPAQSRIARCIAWLMGLPTRRANGNFQFELQKLPNKEVWLRHFPNSRMCSHMRVQSGELIEQFGLVKFKFNLSANQHALTMTLIGTSVGGVPLPLQLLPTIWGREHGANGKFYFDAGASWGKLGRLVAYSGWLEI